MMLREHGAAALAEPRLRRALELSPGDPRAAAELGLVLTSQDRAGEAVRVLDEALDLNPHHPDLLYNLACAQSRAGNLDDALSTLQSALENGFSDFERLGHDSDMQSLRQLKAFAQLIGEPG
jgi:Flp pilus assembly protein TadD